MDHLPHTHDLEHMAFTRGQPEWGAHLADDLEGLFERARMLEPVLEDAIHSLCDEPNVIDVRNLGIAAAVEFQPIEGQASIRAMNVFHHCFDAGVMVRYSGDIIAIGPSTTVSEKEIGFIVDTLRDAIRANQ